MNFKTVHRQNPELRHTSVYMLGWGVATYDALYLAAITGSYQDDRRRRQLQPGRINDTRLDAIIDQLKTEPDVTKRNALIRRARAHQGGELLRDAASPDPSVGDEEGSKPPCTARMTAREARFAKVSGGGS